MACACNPSLWRCREAGSCQQQACQPCLTSELRLSARHSVSTNKMGGRALRMTSEADSWPLHTLTHMRTQCQDCARSFDLTDLRAASTSFPIQSPEPQISRKSCQSYQAGLRSEYRVCVVFWCKTCFPTPFFESLLLPLSNLGPLTQSVRQLRFSVTDLQSPRHSKGCKS